MAFGETLVKQKTLQPLKRRDLDKLIVKAGLSPPTGIGQAQQEGV